MSHHTAHGVSVELPPGWNGEIYRNREEDEPGRPFCLYAVIGSSQRTRSSVERLNAVLTTVGIDAPG